MADAYDSLFAQEKAQKSQAGLTDPPDTYDQIFAAEAEQQDMKLQKVVGLAVKASPDEVARRKALSEQTGVPFDVVTRNEQLIAARKRAEELRSLALDSPILRRQLEDPVFASLAHDDAENLSAFEQAARHFKGASRSIAAGLATDANQAVWGLLEGGARTAGLDTLGGFFAEQRRAQEQYGRLIQGDYGQAGLVEGGMASGFRSFGAMIPGTMMSILTGNPQYMLGMGSVQAGGQAVGKGVEAGINPAQALLYGLEDATAEYATELIPVSRLFKDLKAGAPFLQVLGRQIMLEVPTEIAATAWQNFNEWANLHPEQTVQDYIDKLGPDEAQTIIATITQTVLSAGLAKGASTIIGPFAEQQKKAQQAQQDAVTLTQLNALAEASKLRQRDPKSFQAFVQAAAEEGQVQELYIDAKMLQGALQQSGIDPAQASPEIAQQFVNALATGGDVVIPVGEYAAKIAGTPLEQALAPHLRTSEDAMSPLEAQTFYQNAAEQFKAEAIKLAEEKVQDADWQQSAQFVENVLMAQIRSTNRFTDDVNQGYAKLMGEFYSVMASRLGLTPQEMFARYPLDVRAESVAGEQRMDQVKPIPRGKGRLAFDPIKAADESYTLSPARYAKGKVIAQTPSKDGYKTRAARLASVLARDKWTGREKGYVMSPATAEKFQKLYAEGWDASAITGDLQAPSGQKQPGPLSKLAQAAKSLFAGQKQAEPTPGTALDMGQFFQGEGNRAEISFAKDLSAAPSVITLFKNADLSSFLHEMGHFQLEVLASIASQPNAPAGIVQDMDAALRWFGIQGTDTVLGGEQGGVLGQGDTATQAALEAANTELKQQAEFAVEKVMDDIAINGDGADVSDIVGDPRFWNTEYEEMTEAGYAEYDRRNRALAEERAGFSPAESLDDLNGADQTVQAEAFDAYAESLGLNTRKSYSAGGSRYVEVDIGDESYKFRFADHFNTVRDTTMQPDFNVAPGRNDFTEAIAFLDAKTAQRLAQGGEEGDQPAAPDSANLPKRRTAFEVWQAMSLEEKRPYHEQFARGFEAYLFEGKAPNVELNGLFSRIRAWMVNVYKSVKALGVEINDEIRGVFDRLLATDEAIAQAEVVRSYAPLFASAEQMGATPEEWADYQNTAAAAVDAATRELQARSLRDMRWLANKQSRILRQLQKEATAKRKAVETEVRAEVQAQPVYAVQRYLKYGEIDGAKTENPGKLSIPEMADRYAGTDLGSFGDQPAAWEALGKGKYGMLAKEGLNPDLVAEMFGFSSGDQMVREILAAQPEAVVIEGMTDQRMIERYGDIATADALARAADEAIHNEVRARVVATELKALTKATGPERVIRAAAKAFADNLITGKKVRDIKPNHHAAAETRAAKAAEKALASGDLVTAATEKRNQLVQNYATRASFDALAEVEKTTAYLRKFGKDGTRQNLDAEYLDQIDALMERFDLRKSTTNKEAAKRTSLLAWVEKQRELGFEPDIPAEILSEAARKPYREMTLEEMRGLTDTIKQIEHLGRLKQKLLTAKAERDFQRVRDLLAASIEANGGKPRDLRTRDTTGAVLAEAGNRFLAAHRKMASLAREMDGFEVGGPMWEYLIRSMNEKGDHEATMRADATARLYEIFKPVLAEGRMGGKGTYFPSVRMSLNREERIAIALNTGNDGNMQRLLDGEGWTRDQLQPVLDAITPAEADFVQAIWDFFEGYYPEADALERRIYGKGLDKVPAVPITLGGKELRGGYYPIRYDLRRSGRAEAHNEAEMVKQQMRGAYTTASPRRGYTKARSEQVVGRPLVYSFAGVYQGIHEEIHDLAWREWLIDSNRLLRALDGPIRSYYGPEGVEVFKTGIRDIATGETPAANIFERGLNHIRTGATVAGLGWNLMTSLLQPLGLTQSMVRIGPGWVAKGAAQWMARPLDTLEEVTGKSELMRVRAQTMQREINEIQNQVRGNHRTMLDATFFVLIQKLQLVADVPTWLGEYNKMLAAGEAEARAVALADQAVLDSQGGGQIKDLAQIQRGHPALKLFTNFYSFFNVAYNLGVEKTKQKIGQPRLYPSLVLDYLLLYSLPAALSVLMREAITGGDDDDEELLKKVMAENISYLFGLLVGLREVTAAAQQVAGVEQYHGAYGGPAGLRLFQEVNKLGQQLGQGEADLALFKAANNVGGVVFHYPSGQINKSVDGAVALMEGQTDNPVVLLGGYPKQ